MATNSSKAIAKKVTKEDAVRIGINSVLKLLTVIDNGMKYGGYIWTREMR